MNSLLKNDSTILDLAAVLDRVGGDVGLLREIAAIFLEEYPSFVSDLQEAIGTRDAERLERVAHSLKGSVSNFGADRITQAAFTLEKIGRSRDLQHAAEGFAELQQQFTTLRPALEAIAASDDATLMQAVG